MFYIIILVLGNGYPGRLFVEDNGSPRNVLFNSYFPSSKPTIFFTHTVLTNGLHMTFNHSLDINEIEVFGGMYEQYISMFCTVQLFDNKIKKTVNYTQKRIQTLILLILDFHL